LTNYFDRRGIAVNLQNILFELSQSGVQIALTGDRQLSVTAPKGKLSDRLRSSINTSKDDLISWLLKNKGTAKADVAAKSAIDKKPEPYVPFDFDAGDIDGVLDRIKKSYHPDGPFMVLQAEHLIPRFERYGLDPRSLDRRIFAMESRAQFLQEGMIEKFDALAIKPEHKVLTLGEGNGAPSRLLAKLVGCNILGVDLNPMQVANAQGVAPLHGVEKLVEYVVQDVCKLDLGSQMFDRVYINETAAHWYDKESAFDRIAKHMRPGGRLGIHEWLAGDLGDLNDAEPAVPEFRGLYESGTLFAVTLPDLCAILEKSGLRVLSAADLTAEVDERLRLLWNGLKTLTHTHDDEQIVRAILYYDGMIKTHFNYLRYGRVIAEKQ
jgi:ubiquinone/menaquinone biosynthesis C-methylase UbiE